LLEIGRPAIITEAGREKESPVIKNKRPRQVAEGAETTENMWGMSPAVVDGGVATE
jgi:hypothetical protein